MSKEPEEKLPISETLKVLDYRTLEKNPKWWSAVALIDSWGRKQICFYLWQKKTTKKGEKIEEKWARQQKFTIQDAQTWENISSCVKEFLPQLEAER